VRLSNCPMTARRRNVLPRRARSPLPPKATFHSELSPSGCTRSSSSPCSSSTTFVLHTCNQDGRFLDPPAGDTVRLRTHTSLHRKSTKADIDSRTITAAAVVVSALGHTGMINLMSYVFIKQYIFTVTMLPQVWRLVTAFLITGPGISILFDSYFCRLYSAAARSSF
jgi:hypothetical protein